MELKTIVVLEGDQTGQELLEESLRVLAPDVIGLEIDLPRFDLSLEHGAARPRTPVVHEAAAAIREHGLGPEGGDGHARGARRRRLAEPDPARGDRRQGDRPHRAGAFPGVVPLGGVHAPISVVRMAVGDAYGAKEWREGEGDDEVAFRTERIERTRLPCRRRVRVPRGRAHRREGVRRPEVHGLADVRGDAEGGDGRARRRAIPTCPTSRS